MNKLQMKMNSKVGPLYLVASEKGLHGVYWKRQNVKMDDGKNATAVYENGINADSKVARKFLKKAILQLEEYLDGKRKKFEIPIEPEGTEFQKKVWVALREIPYGETITYGEQAKRIGSPKASRAVGAANGQNPLSIIVPCHRVIGASGRLTGFAGGLGTKAKLLALEKDGKIKKSTADTNP